MPKCKTCKNEDWESTTQFYKRTRQNLNASFYCYPCTREMRKLNPLPKKVKKPVFDCKLISITYLMRKYKLTFEGAKKLANENRQKQGVL